MSVYTVPASISIRHALDTIPYGVFGPNDFLASIYSGRGEHDHAHFVRGSKGDPAESDIYTWVGPIPEALGLYCILNPYRTETVPYDSHEAITNGTGLRHRDIGMICAVVAEDDEGTIDEQVARWDALEAETGLRGVVVMSGDARPESIAAAGVDAASVRPGKSIHWTLPLRWMTPTKRSLATRQAIADHLTAITFGDPQVRDLARKQRMGGVLVEERGQHRIQTMLRGGEAVNAADALTALVTYCERHGVDVHGRIQALNKMNQVKGLLTKHSDDAEACRVLEAVLDRIRSSKAVSDGDLEAIQRYARGSVGNSVSTGGAVSHGPVSDAGTLPEKVWDRDGQVYSLDQLRKVLEAREKLYVVCPHGEAHLDNRSSCYAYIGKGGRLNVRCSSCSSHFEEVPQAVVPFAPEEPQPNLSKLTRLAKAKDIVGVVLHLHEHVYGEDEDPKEVAHGIRVRDAVVQELAEQDEADRRWKALEPAKERYQRKKAEAEALDPYLVDCVRQTYLRAKADASRIWQRLLSEGLVPTDCRAPVLAGQGALSGVAGTYKPNCGDITCREHGAMVVAMKVHGGLHVPVTRDGAVVGEPLSARRELYLWVCRPRDVIEGRAKAKVEAAKEALEEAKQAFTKASSGVKRAERGLDKANAKGVDAEVKAAREKVKVARGARSDARAAKRVAGAALEVAKAELQECRNFEISGKLPFERFLRRWSETTGKDPYGSKGEEIHTDLFPPLPEDRAYVAFHLHDGRILVVATRQPAGLPTPKLTVPGAEIGRVLLELADATYKWIPGEDGLPGRVAGKITSSRGLSLDVEGLLRTARASAWVAHGRVGDERLYQQALEAQGVTTAVDADGSVSTLGYVDPEKIQFAIAQSWVRDGGSNSLDDAETIDVQALLDEDDAEFQRGEVIDILAWAQEGSRRASGE